jgi:RHS repeat-associated protein
MIAKQSDKAWEKCTMFQHHGLNRMIATVLLITFGNMTITTPLLAQGSSLPTAPAATLPLPPLTLPTLVPLQKKDPATTHTSPGIVLLPPVTGSGSKSGKATASIDATVTNGITASGSANPATSSADYAQALARLQELAHQPPAAQSTKSAALLQLNALRSQFRTVLQREAATLRDFARIEAHLRSHNLPAIILQRQQAAVQEHTTRLTQLRGVMALLDDAANGKGDAASAVQQLKLFTARFSSATSQQATLIALPGAATTTATTRSPAARTPTRPLVQRAVSTSTSTGAATSTLPAPDLPPSLSEGAPLPDDLADNAETRLTPEIRALAASLANHPVNIANWVRNHIAFTPGFGSMAGAANTLQAGHGNALDSASLLIALLRAAGIPARYAVGTIEVPAARANGWLGVDHIEAAQTLLAGAGVPTRLLPSTTDAGTLQLQHVWVSAYVDYGPGRAGVNRSPNTWVPIDPSFKLPPGQSGLDLRSAIGLNEAAVFDAGKQGASCSADSASHLDSAALDASLAQYQARLAQFVSGQANDLAVADVLGHSLPGSDASDILPASLPYRTVAVASVFNRLPDTLRWQMRLQLFADSAAQAQGKPLLQLSAPLAQWLQQRVTLSFAPATQLDADTLAAFMPRPHPDHSPVQASEFPPELPAYLIRVTAELRVDGELLASGGNFVLGSEVVLDSASFDPAQGEWQANAATLHAGDHVALALDAQGIAPSWLTTLQARMKALSAQLAANQTDTLSRDAVVGEMLYQSALHWLAASDADNQIARRAANVAAQRLPSHVRAVAQAVPHMALGVIDKVSFPGVILDIGRDASSIAANRLGLPAAAFRQQSAQRHAALAHQILTQSFTRSSRPGLAASAVNVLGTAATQNLPVYGVTKANLATLLPQITLSERAGAELQDAVAAGYTVWVAQTPSTLGGWRGQALLLEDPASGHASYRLLDDHGSASSALYLPAGMPWLAMAQPFQAAASVLPDSIALQERSAALLAQTQWQTKWQAFAAKGEVGTSLFLARLAATQGSGACERLTSLLEASRSSGSSSGGSSDPANAIGVPLFTSLPVTAGSAGRLYQYPALAINSPISPTSPTSTPAAPISYRLIDSPAAISISAGGVLQWPQPVAGDFVITVRADNGSAFTDQRYVLSIGQAALPLDISLALLPAIVNQGQAVTLTVLTNGGSGNVSKSVSVDGQPIALDANGKASITASTIGVHKVQVVASDQLGSTSKAGLFSVRNPLDTTPPQAAISAPQDDAEITAPVTISGTAKDDNLAYYQLLLRPAGGGDSAWQEIDRGSSNVDNGTLGKLDPTILPNGIYELLLNVVDVNGQSTRQQIALDIYRDLKIGQFALSFEDLNIESLGIPIRVTRTYDTKRKGDNLDFGYGWSVGYQDLQVRKNKVTGLQWRVESRPTRFELCLIPEGKRKINIALPTGKVERFTAANAKECDIAQIPAIDIRFTPLPGTTSKLEMVNVPNVVAQGGQLFNTDSQETWNQLDYKLTTEDKYVYYLTEGIGITSVQDRYGNLLRYGQNGILHSNGQSVTFTRDALQRIKTITDPANKTIRYDYDALGNLTTVTDRENATAQFAYNREHGLTSYTDPRKVLAARYVYDTDGRLIAVYDGDNHAVEMTHDINNNQETVKNARGFPTTYTYDNEGNVTEILDALKHKTVIGYDALGNETSTATALQHTTLRSFDPKTGKQLSEQDPLKNTLTWVYDGTELKTSLDAKNNPTTYGWDNDGSLTISEAQGRSSRIGFDDKGNVNNLSIAGQTTRATFDAKGNKLTELDADNHLVSYGYDDNNRETSRSWTRSVIVNGVPVEKTFTSSRKYDANGRILEETDAANNTTQSQYDGTGLLTANIDAQGRKTAYEYDARGKLTKTTFPDNSVETTVYDPEGNPVSKVDRQKRETVFTYDELNRLTKTRYPDGSFTQTEYDEIGRVKATIDAKNRRTVNTWDDAGRLQSVLDANQQKTTFEYDANGNRTKVIDADLRVTEFKYDELNRLTKTIFPDLTFASTVWRPDGRKQSETDASGKTTEYGYSATGQLNQVTQSDGKTTQTTQYSYDSSGNKASQLDAELRTTQWQFDANNRVTSRTLPGLQKESFQYDEVGNLKQKTAFSGKTTSYEYNKLQQPYQTTRPDASTITTYTASGQIDSVSVSTTPTSGWQAGKTRYQYDANDRLTRQDNPDGSFLAWGYDANGNIETRSTKAGTVKYDYEATGKLASVTDVDKQVTRYRYDNLGRMAGMSAPNGVTSTWRYDDNGRLRQLLHKKADGGIVTGVFYKVAANGQRLEMQELDSASSASADDSATPPVNPLRTVKYRYDDTQRLTQEQVIARGGSVSRTTDYEFDKVGNRSKKTDATAAGIETTLYRYDANDRLLQEDKTTATNSQVQTVYTWDDDGNLKSKTVGASVTLYFWNSDNRLIEVKQGASEASAQTVAKYQYDEAGNRIRKIEPGKDGQADRVTGYLTDATFPYAQVVQETVTQGSATESTRYVWGSGLIAQVRGGQGTFYHQDGLGSVKALTDTNGNVTDSYEYEAYGNVENRTGNTVNPYRYTAEYFDEAIGLQYNRARWYAASVGRFVSHDVYYGDSSVPISINKYLYANTDPISNLDPSGLMTLLEVENAQATQEELQKASAQQALKSAFKQAGCDLGTGLAQEAVNYGIYILIDTVSGNLYVGQAKNIDKRFQQHIKEATKKATSAWKANAKIMARFPIPGGPAALSKAEQLIIDVLEKTGQNLLNKNTVIGPNNRTPKAEYNAFKKIICPKS